MPLAEALGQIQPEQRCAAIDSGAGGADSKASDNPGLREGFRVHDGRHPNMTHVRTLALASLALMAAASVTACKPAETNTDNSVTNTTTSTSVTNDTGNAVVTNTTVTNTTTTNTATNSTP
jgi:hypothetical protein